jgi:hypothetical protein
MMPPGGEAKSSPTVTEHPPPPPVPPISDRGHDDEVTQVDDYEAVNWEAKYVVTNTAPISGRDIAEEQRALAHEQRTQFQELSENESATSAGLPLADPSATERHPRNITQELADQLKKELQNDPARQRSRV